MFYAFKKLMLKAKVKKIIKGWFRALTFIALLLLPTMVFASSSYTSHLSFLVTHKGITRSYTGNDVGISIRAYTEGQQWFHPTHYDVELYRKNWFGSSFIGTAQFPRNGFRTATWTNVGSGNYFFFFSKANDGVRVVSNEGDVRMFSR